MFEREDTISWLEANRSHGAFEGFPEEDMDFYELSDEEIAYYYTEWVLPDLRDTIIQEIEDTRSMIEGSIYHAFGLSEGSLDLHFTYKDSTSTEELIALLERMQEVEERVR